MDLLPVTIAEVDIGRGYDLVSWAAAGLHRTPPEAVSQTSGAAFIRLLLPVIKRSENNKIDAEKWFAGRLARIVAKI